MSENMTNIQSLEFLDMLSTQEERKLGRFEQKNKDDILCLIVDTCSVTDSADPYETAVSHLDYNPGEWAITETYQTYEEAVVGHQRWIKIMTSEPLPAVLHSVWGDGRIFSKINKEIQNV